MFLLASISQSPAQSGLNPWPKTDSERTGMCRDMEIRVKNSSGGPIMGAAVTLETYGIPLTTDAQGLISIPCRPNNGVAFRMQVSAPGYKALRVTMSPTAASRLEVTLDAQEIPGKAGVRTISARELRQTVQVDSRNLQNQAARALERRDYDTAEKLLLQAQELTPSLPGIANNLGIVALRRKDLNAAGAWIEKAMQIAPTKADIVANLGLIRWMQHRSEESYKLLRKAAAMGHETALGNYIIGKMGVVKGLNKEAADHLRKIPPKRFPHRDLYLSLALRNMGKTKAAEEAYRNFLHRNPVPYAISTLAVCRGSLGPKPSCDGRMARCGPCG